MIIISNGYFPWCFCNPKKQTDRTQDERQPGNNGAQDLENASNAIESQDFRIQYQRNPTQTQGKPGAETSSRSANNPTSLQLRRDYGFFRCHCLTVPVSEPADLSTGITIRLYRRVRCGGIVRQSEAHAPLQSRTNRNQSQTASAPATIPPTLPTKSKLALPLVTSRRRL